MQSNQAVGYRRTHIVSACAALFASFSCLPTYVYANCLATGTQTICDTNLPSPWTTTVGRGKVTPPGSTVIVAAGTQISTKERSAISLADDAQITIGTGAVVQSEANNLKVTGKYATGANTIELRDRGTVIIEEGARVISTGTVRRAEAINVQGSDNIIINHGLIEGKAAAAVWFQNNSGTNTIKNSETGVLKADGNVSGSSGNGSVKFENHGTVDGNLFFANGDDHLTLDTQSVITGNFNGGGGHNTIQLDGEGSASLPGKIRNFPVLYKEGSGTWTLNGAVSGVKNAEVRQGTLVLNGDNFNYTGAISVAPAGTLRGPAQSLPPSILNNGMLQFAQEVNGSYTGAIRGSGQLEKLGAGTLTLTPSKQGGITYQGGTIITEGTLAIAEDSAIGAAAGQLVFNGGRLQFGGTFNLASTRPLSISAQNGMIDTQSFHSVIAQNIEGAGSLTKQGVGTLTLNGTNGYAGGTQIDAGTLIIGDGTAPFAALNGGGKTSVAKGAALGGYGHVTGDVINHGVFTIANAMPDLMNGKNGAFQIHGDLINAGVVQIGGQGVGNTLIVAGHYVGQDGATLNLNTQLGADHSPSDKLILNRGTASGSTHLSVTNIGGSGALTTGDGIEVVQAVNGATTAPGAFIQNGEIKAGAYDYALVRGGVHPDTAEHWYLRSHQIVETRPEQLPGDPEHTPTAEEASPNTTGMGPAPINSPKEYTAQLRLEAPRYRAEVPIYTEMPSVGRQLGLLQIDTFHNRYGDQELLAETGRTPAAWARAWGNHSEIAQSGSTNQSFDGTLWGLQIGQDLYANQTANGHRNHYGVFFGFSRAVGNISGHVLNTLNRNVGALRMNAYNLGGYWTHVGPGGWYTDAVAMGGVLSVDTGSRDGVSASTSGSSFTGSVEAGAPIPLARGFTFEPQAQLLWQYQSFSNLDDKISTVSWNNNNAFLARAGARLQWQFNAAAVDWLPYLRVNVLRSFGGQDKATFGGSTQLNTHVGQTSGQIGVGITAQVSKHGSLYAAGSYLANLGGERQRVWTGNAGVRWAW